MTNRRISVPYSIIAYFGPNYLGDNGKDEVNYNCPECVNRKGTPDTDGHLYVNTRSLIFHCYRCDYAGRIGKNVKISRDLVYDEDKSHATSELIKEFSGIIEKSDNDFKLKIPIDKVTTSESATKYLLDRGFTYKQMEYYDMRVGNLSQDFGRIVIPNRVHRMVYTDMYSARTYIGQDPKYKNPYDIKKSEIVFNLHRITPGTPIIVVEGALTAVAAGYHAVACLGKNLSYTQAGMIASKKPSVVYVNFDYGAEAQAYEACRRLKRVLPDIPIYNVLMKDERDAADMTRQEYVDCLMNARLYQPLIDGMEEIVGEV